MTVTEAAAKRNVTRQMILRYIHRRTNPLKATRNLMGEWEITARDLARFKPLAVGRPRNGEKR